MSKVPIIIDCDPGLDDAVAIAMLLGHPKLDVLGITSVAGNVGLAHTTQNALNLVEALGFSTPVSVGAALPLMREQVTAEYVHGQNGFGTVVLSKAKSEATALPAANFIRKHAMEQDGNLVLLAVGPLTNIAVLLTQYPQVKPLIKELVIMGGAINGGNITPAAEFNIFADPEAAQIVFRSGIPVIMGGLEAGDTAMLTDNDIAEIGAVGTEKAKLMESFLLSAKKNEEQFGLIDLPMYDPAAAMYLLNPEAMQLKEAHIDVEIWGEFTYGKTVVDFNTPSNCKVVLELEREALKAELIEAAKRA